jgi:LIM domain
MKSKSLISSIQNGDVPAPPRRSAVSVPSSPEKTTIGLPRVSTILTRQGSRGRSVTSTNARQPPVEPRSAQLPPTPSRPPMSAFSQRFVSGKPTPAEPQVTTTRVTSTRGGGGGNHDDSGGNASIFVSEPELPQITFSDPTEPSLDRDDHEAPPTDEIPRDHGRLNHTPIPATGGGRIFPPASSARRGGGLACGGCSGPIVGRIVSAMGVRWHPGCFRCSDCNDLLEYVSSYERDGKPYCHFDYHEVCVCISELSGRWNAHIPHVVWKKN